MGASPRVAPPRARRSRRGGLICSRGAPVTGLPSSSPCGTGSPCGTPPHAGGCGRRDWRALPLESAGLTFSRMRVSAVLTQASGSWIAQCEEVDRTGEGTHARRGAGVACVRRSTSTSRSRPSRRHRTRRPRPSRSSCSRRRSTVAGHALKMRAISSDISASVFFLAMDELLEEQALGLIEQPPLAEGELLVELQAVHVAQDLRDLDRASRS